jgi:hypothetical protein
MKVLRFNESSISDKFSDLGDLSFAHVEYGIDSSGNCFMQIEKKEGGKNFLTIVSVAGVYSQNRYNVNITTGTIANYEKYGRKPFSNITTWYGLTNKRSLESHTVSDVWEQFLGYGIGTLADKEIALSAYKYNI